MAALMGERRAAVEERSMPVTREQLYEEVWTVPLRRLAERYGVPPSVIVDVCARLGVPRPANGHWARVRRGTEQLRPVLPAVVGTQDVAWAAPANTSWAPGPKVTERGPALLAACRPHFDAGRVVSGPFGPQPGYVRPAKGALVDLVVSRVALDRAFETAGRIFAALASRSVLVQLIRDRRSLSFLRRPDLELANRDEMPPILPERAWIPSVVTVAPVHELWIGLSLFEPYEYCPMATEMAPSSQPTREAGSASLGLVVPSGKLALRAYSPYEGSTWECEWREGELGDLGGRAEAIADELVGEAAEQVRRARSAGLQAASKQEERRRVAELEEAQNCAKDRELSRAALLAMVAAWNTAQGAEQFFTSVEQRLKGSPRGERLLRKLDEARGLLREADAVERLREWSTPDDRAEARRVSTLSGK